MTFEAMVFANPLREQLLAAPVGDPATMVDGCMPVPEGTGLGVTLDRAALNAMRISD